MFVILNIATGSREPRDYRWHCDWRRHRTRGHVRRPHLRGIDEPSAIAWPGAGELELFVVLDLSARAHAWCSARRARLAGGAIGQARPLTEQEPAMETQAKPTILILCTGNSCRSHMAEGILRDVRRRFARCPKRRFRPHRFRSSPRQSAPWPTLASILPQTRPST